MRTLMRSLIGIVLVAVVVGLGVLVAQNGQSEQFTFLGTTFQGNMGWLAAGAVALGFVLAVLVLIPGRLASAWRGWWLGRRGQALEDQLRALREQHAELQSSHRRLVEEHQRVMQQGPTPVTAGRERDAAPLPRTGPIIPPGSAREARLLGRVNGANSVRRLTAWASRSRRCAWPSRRSWRLSGGPEHAVTRIRAGRRWDLPPRHPSGRRHNGRQIILLLAGYSGRGGTCLVPRVSRAEGLVPNAGALVAADWATAAGRRSHPARA